MSAEQIAAELDELLAGPYSRSAQRRIALLTGFDSDLTFGDQCGEDTFENVIGLAMQVSLLIVGQARQLANSRLRRAQSGRRRSVTMDQRNAIEGSPNSQLMIRLTPSKWACAVNRCREKKQTSR
jgi:hypothetical protein